MNTVALLNEPTVWPLVILGICVGGLVILIGYFRFHAFLALIIVALLGGILTAPGRLPGESPRQIHIKDKEMVIKKTDDGKILIRPVTPEDSLLPQDVVVDVTIIEPYQVVKTRFIKAIDAVTGAVGATAGQIAVVIALASVLSTAVMESGAADRIVRSFIKIFGEKRAGGVLTFCGYFLSIPIFFDTFFMLLLPLAKGLAIRTGQNFLLFVLAIATSGSITHSLLIPHPGPLAMASMLNIDIGLSIIVGIFVGLIPVFFVWQLAKFISRRLWIPIRNESTTVEIKEEQLPSIWLSLLPIFLPIILISTASCIEMMKASFKDNLFFVLLRFLGDRNIALLVGTIIALWILKMQRTIPFKALGMYINQALETAGVIILITSAGGAFGTMLRYAGVGEALQSIFQGRMVDLIVLAWGIAAVIRIAQGSATIAMMTAVGMIAPMMNQGLPYHPIYIFMAIGFGAMIFSWMNDSGFWVICKLSGMSEIEALKSWTVIVTANSIVGLLTCVILSRVIPGI